jgi:hypothetical protein
MHGDVGHEAVRGGAVPVVLAGLEEDAVAGADLLDRAALALAEADALGDEDGLARPSTLYEPARCVLFRPTASFLSTAEDDLDALDESNVVKSVVMRPISADDAKSCDPHGPRSKTLSLTPRKACKQALCRAASSPRRSREPDAGEMFRSSIGAGTARSAVWRLLRRAPHARRPQSTSAVTTST